MQRRGGDGRNDAKADGRGQGAEQVEQQQQEPADVLEPAAAGGPQSTVHAYDYIVPTGGRHYEVRSPVCRGCWLLTTGRALLPFLMQVSLLMSLLSVWPECICKLF